MRKGGAQQSTQRRHIFKNSQDQHTWFVETGMMLEIPGDMPVDISETEIPESSTVNRLTTSDSFLYALHTQPRIHRSQRVGVCRSRRHQAHAKVGADHARARHGQGRPVGHIGSPIAIVRNFYQLGTAQRSPCCEVSGHLRGESHSRG